MGIVGERSWAGDGKITSVVDLIDAQMFIYPRHDLLGTGEQMHYELEHLGMRLGTLDFMVFSSATRHLGRNSRPYWQFRFASTLDGVLASLRASTYE
jgi:hypothetical protein